MKIWGDVAGKQTKLRIAIAALHVAENLVISPVLLDDVNHVFDGTRATGPGWNRIAGGRRNLRHALLRRAQIRLRRVGGELFGKLLSPGQIDDAQGAWKQFRDALDFSRAPFPGLRTVGICPRSHAREKARGKSPKHHGTV